MVPDRGSPNICAALGLSSSFLELSFPWTQRAPLALGSNFWIPSLHLPSLTLPSLPPLPGGPQSFRSRPLPAMLPSPCPQSCFPGPDWSLPRQGLPGHPAPRFTPSHLLPTSFPPSLLRIFPRRSSPADVLPTYQSRVFAVFLLFTASQRRARSSSVRLSWCSRALRRGGVRTESRGGGRMVFWGEPHRTRTVWGVRFSEMVVAGKAGRRSRIPL